jgi:hypothetical protein
VRAVLIPLTAAFAAALLLPGSLQGQTVRGRVVEAETGVPIPAAVVVLEDARGARVATVLADAEGRYRVRAPGAGTYRLRAERVGYANPAAVTLTLADGQTVEHELRTESRRVVLDVVVAEGQRRRCAGRPQEGAVAATVWDEARKALAAAALAQESGEYSFLTELRIHDTDLDRRNVMRDSTRQVVMQGRPFVAATVEELVTGGYVVLEPRRVEMMGVDATAILSDLFVQHHCFGLRRPGREQQGLVGLEFVPLDGRVEPDVRGVLWLDRATAELRYVEYTYTGLGFRGPVDRLGGRIDFQRVPDGTWIIPSWMVRAPLLQTSIKLELTLGSMRRFRMYGISEQSGRVVEIRRGDGTPVPLGP